MRIGAIEGGGTKMVLAVCTENGEILEQKNCRNSVNELEV